MRWFVCTLIVALTGCVAPMPAGNSGVTAATTSGPRFSKTGPDANEFGAANGYPMGDRTSFWRIPQLVGSHSHLDELFPSRLVRRAAGPSPLARAATEPLIRYVYQDAPLG